jgi:LysR family glycine cleavage system transcriptional activator
MYSQMPSLKGLRAFEAVVRHHSATSAADELHVSPGAVGHQIRSLEQHLGLRLFERSGRQYVPTVEALEIAAQIREGFDQIFGAVRRLRMSNDPGFLTISCETTLGALWLAPRIPNFQKKHPNIQVRLDLSNYDQDFQRRGIDLAIRPGHGSFPGCVAIRLTEEMISPVCAPHFLCDGANSRALRSPSDLLMAPLLHVEWFDEETSFRTTAWERWFSAAGIKTNGGALPGMHYSHTFVSLPLAIAGSGIALASECLAADAIASGSLVRPFDIWLRIPRDYYLLYGEGDRNFSKAVAFRDWLVGEMAVTIGH